MVRNEARDLGEWFAYHAALGFDTFFIYENGSDDGTWDLIQRAQKTWDVRARQWRFPGRFRQIAAFNHCLLTQAWGYDWVLFIDADEFFTPIGCEDVKTFLAPMGHATGIALNWACYGSSRHKDFPPGLLIENFKRRGRDIFGANYLSKSFARPGRRLCKSPHYFPGFGAYVDASGAPVKWGAHPGRKLDVDLSRARITHFFTRSEAHWQAKISRGYHTSRSREGQFKVYDRNEIKDDSAARFAAATHAELEKLARV
jgi:glycosyltransferase involved in cell wall biosynthesis